MRKEIEVKAKIGNLEEITKKLIALGCILSGPVTQNDKTFVNANYGEYDKFQRGKNILRIRESNGKFLFTVKQPQSNELDAIEYETEISSSEEFEKALILMEYKPIVEIEKITEDDDANRVQDELFGFLKNIGVDEKDRVLQ